MSKNKRLRGQWVADLLLGAIFMSAGLLMDVEFWKVLVLIVVYSFAEGFFGEAVKWHNEEDKDQPE